jgi:hypothetical protein
MIESNESAFAVESEVDEDAPVAQPTEAPAAEAPAPVADAAGQPRRATKFLADLSRAMQAAAEQARAETMARFDAEAKAVAEEIRAKATDEAADLRRKADDDVAAIREWSKAEIARIREATDERIAARKSALDGEVEQHAAVVEARVDRVGAVVSAFETQMAAFFERLNAEEDPTRIATMAETMPEPPSLADVAASVAGAPEPTTWEPPAPEPVVVPTFDEPEAPAPVDFAAAEAEALSFDGDLEAEELPEPDPEALEAQVEGALPTTEDERLPLGDAETSRVVVTGLVSVANIANFKRSLGRTPGVSSIAVASGPDGDFIFTVGHTLGTELSASVRDLPGFDVQITDESDDGLHVAAQDRDATE